MNQQKPAIGSQEDTEEQEKAFYQKRWPVLSEKSPHTSQQLHKFGDVRLVGVGIMVESMQSEDSKQ